MARASELLAVAEKEVGYRQARNGSNKYGRWYGMDCQRWCVMFVMWCATQIQLGLPTRTASCGTLMRAAQAAGQWVTRDFKPGDLIIFDWSKKRSGHDHIGICKSVTATYITTIDGNTSATSQDNGGCVQVRIRPLIYVTGAVRPIYEPEKQKPKTEEDKMVYYEKLKDVPEWYKGAIQKCIDKGALKGEGNGVLNLSEDLCRTLTILDRLGNLGK